MNAFRAPALAAALLALAASPARADLVRLFDGKTIEGKVSRGANKVTVKMYKGKSVTYAASEVKFAEEAKCSWEVAADMNRAVPADASETLYVEKHLEIARYLKERRVYCAEMAELEAKEYELVVKKAPENDEARVGLGHVKWGTWWFKNEADRDRFRKSAPPADMEPKGFVKYRKTGMWESKEDVEALDAGKVKYRGRWMTEDEKKEAQGYMKDEKGNWILKRDVIERERSKEVTEKMGEKPVSVMSSENFRLISWFPLNDTAQLKELAEKTYVSHREVLGIPVPKGDDAGEKVFSEPLEVFFLLDGLRKEKWIKAYAKDHGWSDELINHRMDHGDGWFGQGEFPYLLTSGPKPEKNRERDVEHDLERAKSSLTSMIGRMLLNAVRGEAPAWFGEANGLMAEIRMNETADCNFASMAKYQEEIANKVGSKAKYFDFMKQQIGMGLDRTLLQLFSLELNDLDWSDSVKCWSFLEFLNARYRPEYLKLVRQPTLPIDEIQPIHVDAAIKAKKIKDPASQPLPGKEPKDEGPLPTGPQTVNGPGAIQVTEGSKEARAIQGAMSEAWIRSVLDKDLALLEKEWKDWIVTHP